MITKICGEYTLLTKTEQPRDELFNIKRGNGFNVNSKFKDFNGEKMRKTTLDGQSLLQM